MMGHICVLYFCVCLYVPECFVMCKPTYTSVSFSLSLALTLCSSSRVYHHHHHHLPQHSILIISGTRRVVARRGREQFGFQYPSSACKELRISGYEWHIGQYKDVALITHAFPTYSEVSC